MARFESRHCYLLVLSKKYFNMCSVLHILCTQMQDRRISYNFCQNWTDLLAAYCVYAACSLSISLHAIFFYLLNESILFACLSYPWSFIGCTACIYLFGTHWNTHYNVIVTHVLPRLANVYKHYTVTYTVYCLYTVTKYFLSVFYTGVKPPYRNQ